MFKLAALLSAISIAGCGANQVKIEIRGGDGQFVRLDANDVQYKFNHLVKAGTYVLPKPDSKIELGGGAYAVNVAAGDYLGNEVLQVESTPLWGVRTYEAIFDIPAGSNAPFKREGTILYASTKKNVRNWDLFTIKADGSDRQQLTNTPEPEQHPSWSPDGKKILFTRGDVMSNIDLYVMDADSSNAVRLTEHPERDQRGVFSPDGETIAFVSERDGDKAVWLMAADGSNPRKLVQGREPSFSPDGRRIAFTSSAFDDNDELYLIDLDGIESDSPHRESAQARRVRVVCPQGRPLGLQLGGIWRPRADAHAGRRTRADPYLNCRGDLRARARLFARRQGDSLCGQDGRGRIRHLLGRNGWI